MLESSNDLGNQYKILHESDRSFGGDMAHSMYQYHLVKKILETYRPKTIIDYGCGKGLLKTLVEKDFDVTYCNYDPYIPEYSQIPMQKFDLLINTDVLEHIPEECVDGVIEQMAGLCSYAYFNISCRKARQLLPNGENAHCTIYPPRWWKHKLEHYFLSVSEIDTDDLAVCTFIATSHSNTFIQRRKMFSTEKIIKRIGKACVKALPYFIAKKCLDQIEKTHKYNIQPKKIKNKNLNHSQ